MNVNYKSLVTSFKLNSASFLQVVFLVEDMPHVTIKREARSRAVLKADGNPRLLVRYLLEELFTEEQLASGSALGARKSHNSKAHNTTTLDNSKIKAIKSKYYQVIKINFG